MISGRFFKKLILILVLPAIALSAIFVHELPVWDIGYVKHTAWENGVLYGADEKNGNIRIFGCDEYGNNAWIDTVYSADGKNTTLCSVEQFGVSENGICNLLLKSKDITEQNRYILISYDINKKQIAEKENIDITEDNNIYIKKEIGSGTWYVSNNGSVWKNGIGNGTLLFLNDGSSISEKNSAYTFGKDGLYFYNLEDDAFYTIPYSDGIMKKAENMPINADINSFGTLFSLNEAKDGTWTASFYNTDSHLLPMVMGKSTEVIERLNIPAQQAFFIVIALSCALIALIFIVYILVRKIRKSFPTELKIISVSVLLLILSCFVVKIAIEGLLKDDVENRIFSQMRYTAGTVNNNTNLQSTYLEGQAVNVYENIADSTAHEVIYNYKGELISDFEGIVGYVSVLGYKDGTLFSMDTGSLFCEPLVLLDEENELKSINKACEIKTPVKSIINTYNMGKCLALYYPVVQDNEVTGIIRTLYTENSITEDIREQKPQILNNIFIFLFGIVLFLAVISFLLLRPLNKIKNALADFSVGIDMEEPESGSGSEISEMMNLFYNLTVNVKEHLYNVDQLKKAYEPYIPQKLISLFGKNDIRQISPEDETIIKDAAILVIDAMGFSKAVSKADVQEMFLFVNSALEKIVSGVENEGGVVLQFTDTGMFAFFQNMPDKALKAAVEIQKSLQCLPKKLGGEGEKIVFSAGMILGDINVGVIGAEDRMEIRAVSPEMSFARYLQKVSGIYNLGILIDETFKDSVERFNEKETIRRIGRISFSGNIKSSRTIYEAFGGQMPEFVKLKQLTREDFESGVDYFHSGNYTKAKECFIRVLRMNKDDMAAGRYLKLCSDKISCKEKGMNAFEQY